MSTGIKGVAVTFTIGGTDYSADVTSIQLTNTDPKDSVTTFADVATGGARLYQLVGTAIQSGDTASFWRTIWANTGQTAAFRYNPWGAETASAAQPDFVGTVTLGPRPNIGGDAAVDGADFTFDWTFDCVGVPALDDGSSAEATLSTVAPSGQHVGQNVVLTGTGFTGATDVKFATVSATSFYVISDSTIAAVIPAGTGSKAVTVVNTSGASNAISYTVAT